VGEREHFVATTAHRPMNSIVADGVAADPICMQLKDSVQVVTHLFSQFLEQLMMRCRAAFDSTLDT
jgi:hypothetical protein